MYIGLTAEQLEQVYVDEAVEKARESCARRLLEIKEGQLGYCHQTFEECKETVREVHGEEEYNKMLHFIETGKD